MDEALRDAVLHRLALLDEVAERGEAEALARAEIHRLADGWRLLLTLHRPGEDGRCRSCPGWLRRRRWPCRVWTTAHRHLVGGGPSHRERRRPPRTPFTRSGVIGIPAETPAGMTTEPRAPTTGPPPKHRALDVSRPKHALPE